MKNMVLLQSLFTSVYHLVVSKKFASKGRALKYGEIQPTANRSTLVRVKNLLSPFLGGGPLNNGVSKVICCKTHVPCRET